MGMALLRARDPIQFYAEVPLYESELDDNGSSQLSVKVTMPTFSLLHVVAKALCHFAVTRWPECARLKDISLDSGQQVRVMPSCWFVLLRFFLRVDGTLVRLREARFFCDLKQPDKVQQVLTIFLSRRNRSGVQA